MINKERLLATFLDLVKIDSPSGEEGAVGNYVVARLDSLGIKARPDETGNILAYLDGTGEPLMLNAHLDTVMPGKGIKPQVKDGIVRSDGTTILGGDDKSGVALILEAIQSAIESKTPTCPLDIVFTVREETGLWGAKGLDSSRLHAREGLIFDHGGPVENVVVGAPSQNNIDVAVHGKAAHAGVNPEAGINAIQEAADAIMRFPIGRIDEETTANVGIIQGGIARNIVPDTVKITAEARSLKVAKLEAQTEKMKSAFEAAVAKYGGSVEINVERSYDAFSIPADASIFRRLSKAASSMGLELKPETTGGGSDANVFNKNGIQCIIVSSGMEDVHTTEEWLNIDIMNRSAELTLKVISQV